jgi:hypothetical protein
MQSPRRCAALMSSELRRVRAVQGVIPRVCLGVWQTLFMVTGAQLAKDFMKK